MADVEGILLSTLQVPMIIPNYCKCKIIVNCYLRGYCVSHVIFALVKEIKWLTTII
jgi:hypothetical protein